MSEWRRVKLEELYEVHNGLSKARSFFGSGYPFLSFSTVFNNWFLPESLDSLVQSTTKEREAFSIKRGDVFITRTSETPEELGMSSVALKDYPDATFNGFCKRLRQISDDIVPEFAGYVLRSHDFRSRFYGLAGNMTSRASLRNDDLLEMTISLPPLASQRRIASFLFNYESAIANCKRQISLLEEAAMRLYNEWFKAGKGEKGPISKWFSVSIGRTPPRKVTSYFSTMADDMLWCSIADIKATNVFVFNTAEKLTKQALIDSKIHISPMGSVLLSFKLTVGRVAIAAAPLATNEAIAHFETENRALRDYTYCFLHEFPYATLGSTSAIGTAINSDIVKRIPFIMPTIRDLERFSKAVSPVFDAILAFGLQVRVLAEARDRLLPKLMKGEIAV